MPQVNRSAMKRVLQSQRQAVRNVAIKSRTKTAIRRFREALAQNDEALIQEKLRQAVRVIDKAVTKGVLHKNTAARTKTRLCRLLKK